MNKNKTKNRILVGLLLLVIIILVLKLLRYPVPFVTKYEAKKYLSEYFGRDDIKIKYDIKNNKYYIKKTGDGIKYNFDDKTIFDEGISRKVNIKANMDFDNMNFTLDNNISLPRSIHMYTSFSVDDYNLQKNKLYLLDIREAQEVDKEIVNDRIADIGIEIINNLGDDYNITDLQFIYENLNGMYEVVINSGNSFHSLTRKDILDNIRSMKETELSEEYLKWRESVHQYN